MGTRMKDFLTISSTKKIKVDKWNYIYCIKKKPTDKVPDGFHAEWYYPTLEQCYNDLLECFTKDSDKESLVDKVKEAVELLEKVKVKV